MINIHTHMTVSNIFGTSLHIPNTQYPHSHTHDRRTTCSTSHHTLPTQYHKLATYFFFSPLSQSNHLSLSNPSDTPNTINTTTYNTQPVLVQLYLWLVAYSIPIDFRCSLFLFSFFWRYPPQVGHFDITVWTLVLSFWTPHLHFHPILTQHTTIQTDCYLSLSRLSQATMSYK